MEEREVRPPDPVVTKQLIDDEPRTPPNEPEDLEPGSFVHKIGEILNPTR